MFGYILTVLLSFFCMIHQQPKKTLLQFPGLWLPGSSLPGALSIWPWCCCGLCADCVGHSPDQMQIVLANVANANCVACNNWNDTFILDRHYQNWYCAWDFNGDQWCAGARETLYCSFSWVANALVVRAWSGVGLGVAHFQKDYGSLPRCNPSSESIPLVSDDDSECDFSAATCVITAL